MVSPAASWLDAWMRSLAELWVMGNRDSSLLSLCQAETASLGSPLGSCSGRLWSGVQDAFLFRRLGLGEGLGCPGDESTSKSTTVALVGLWEAWAQLSSVDA